MDGGFVAPRLAGTTPPLADTGQTRRRPWWLVALGAAGVVLVAVLLLSLINTSPKFVSRVTVVNRTPYDLQVSVTNGHGNGWMELTTAKAQASTDINQVVDQGGTWTFRFSGQGIDGGELTLSRSALAQSSWRVTVPDAVSQRLAGAHAPTTPNTSTP
jgi:hypothetical protein